LRGKAIINQNLILFFDTDKCGSRKCDSRKRDSGECYSVNCNSWKCAKCVFEKMCIQSNGLELHGHRIISTIVQLIQKCSWKFFAIKSFHGLKIVCLNTMKFSDLKENLTWHKFSWLFLNFLDNVSSKMMFLNSKKSFQSLGSEYSLITNLETTRHFLFYKFETNQRS
jgi:hypothetical protein